MQLPAHLESSIKEGESERLEFKVSIHEPLLLAKLMASFANASGGQIFVGISEIPPFVRGVDRNRIERIYKTAIARIDPHIDSRISFLQIGDKEVADISVEQSGDVVLVEGGAFIRIGNMTHVMGAGQFRDRQIKTGKTITVDGVLAESQKQSAMLQKLIDQNDRLLEKNEELRLKVDSLNDPALRLKERVIGGCIGVVASLIAATIWLIATKQIPWLRSDPGSSNTAMQLTRHHKVASDLESLSLQFFAGR
jgi:predicted HTH transcriptional regulator